MSDEISFFVAGIPAPQGSMIPITVPGKKFTQVVPDNASELNAWRAKVTAVARLAAGAAGWPDRAQQGMHLTCRFFLPMPATRPALHRKRGITPCGVKPDLDKLMRAIGDALTDARVVFDDSRIYKGGQIKYEVADHTLCGAEVVLRMIDYEMEMETMMASLARRQANRVTVNAGRRRTR